MDKYIRGQQAEAPVPPMSHLSITMDMLAITNSRASALTVLLPNRSAPICEQLSTFRSAVSNTTTSFCGVVWPMGLWPEAKRLPRKMNIIPNKRYPMMRHFWISFQSPVFLCPNLFKDLIWEQSSHLTSAPTMTRVCLEVCAACVPAGAKPEPVIVWSQHGRECGRICTWSAKHY